MSIVPIRLSYRSKVRGEVAEEVLSTDRTDKLELVELWFVSAFLLLKYYIRIPAQIYTSLSSALLSLH